MRIGIITSWMRLGWGVDLTLHFTASALTALGNEVRLYTAEHDGSFAAAPYTIVHRPLAADALFPRLEWRARKHVRYFADEPNDAYLIATQPYFYYPWLLPQPTVNYEFGIVPTTGFPWSRKLMWSYMKATQFYLYHPGAAAIVSNSDFTRRELPSFLQTKTRTIYHGVEHYDPLHPDHDFLFPSPLLVPDPRNPRCPVAAPVDRRSNRELREEFRQENDFADSDVVGLYVGRINPVAQPYKGVAELFATIPKVMKDEKRLKWVMVGLGGEADANMCRAAGMIPLLNLPDWQMRKIFVGCDFYASASKWEGFNLPIMEAQYFGRPVVAYNRAAHPEVVKAPTSGYLVNDAREFERAIRELTTNEKARADLGREGARYAAGFTWRRCATAFEELFHDIVQGWESAGRRTSVVNDIDEDSGRTYGPPHAHPDHCRSPGPDTRRLQPPCGNSRGPGVGGDQP